MHAFQKINELFLVLSQSEAVEAVIFFTIQISYIKETEYT